MATHVFLESCARKEVGIYFVGECWVALTGNGTQSHPDYVMLGSASKGTKVVVFVRRNPGGCGVISCGHSASSGG